MLSYRFDVPDTLNTQEAEHALFQKHKNTINAFATEITNGVRPAFSLCLNGQQERARAQAVADELRTRFTDVLWLGMGGSSLGGALLSSTLRFESVSTNRPAPRLHFLDNSDPESLHAHLQNLPLKTTAVVAVSKSGGTIETLAQLGCVANAFHAEGFTLKERLWGISEPTDTPLHKILQHYEAPLLEHDPLIGGRFSLFSIVGLLPYLIAGGDAERLHQGAQQVLESFLEFPLTHGAALSAAQQVALWKKGFHQAVLMPYSDRISALSDWWVQLWAESLGKKNKGSWPIAARGATDQHASLQMLADGANERVITVLQIGSNSPLQTPAQWADITGKAEHNGLKMATLFKAQAQGTADALKAQGRPVRLMSFDTFSPSLLGGLTMGLMLETVCAGFFWGIDPWQQDAVEDAKSRALTYLKSQG